MTKNVKVSSYLAIALAVLSVFWISATSWAQNVRQSVIVVIAPTAADGATLGVSRDALSRVDLAAASMLAGQPAIDSVLQAHSNLQQAVDETPDAVSYVQLDDVSMQLVRAFERGTLPQGNLFSAARKVSPLSEEAAQESSLPRVSVTRSVADHQKLTGLIEELNAAISALSEKDLAAIRGDLSGHVADLSDEQLVQIVADGGGAGEQAQLELDRRLAANLPDLSGYSNGQLPDELLCTIPWAPEDRILCAALPNLTRMSEAFKAEFGTDIPILDGYRPLSEQITVHHRDPNWTAIPGTSNHGWGLAVDLGWDTFREWEAPEVKWMLENGYKFGWRLPQALSQDSDRPEPWHYEFGTSYSGDDSADFVGPTPPVIYRFKMA